MEVLVVVIIIIIFVLPITWLITQFNFWRNTDTQVTFIVR